MKNQKITHIVLVNIFIILLFVNCKQISENSESNNKIIETSLIKAQNDDELLENYDFENILSIDKYNYGFIGGNYQRFYIKILSILKSKENPHSYSVSGKTKVKNNICDFKGELIIEKIEITSKIDYGLDEEYEDSGIIMQGVIFGKYILKEDKTQLNSGVLEGKFNSFWYIDKNYDLCYDDIQSFSDNYKNNQFEGIWRSYNSQNIKICNWGNCRIPNSGDFDIGVGEFSPNEKYLKNGWQNFHDAFYNNNEQKQKRAKEIELKEWWK
jgi:hypothetical protein